MKKIIYIANARIPTEKAHGIQIMKMCQAFAAAGHEVRLVVPKRVSHIAGEAFSYYRMQKSFEIVYLPTWDLIRLSGYVPKVFAFLANWSFARSVKKYLTEHKADLIYTRDELVASQTASNYPVFLEVHNLSRTLLRKVTYLNQYVKKIIVITRGLQEAMERLGYQSDKFIVLPDGVDLEQFDSRYSTFDIRSELGLPQDKQIVMYTGHLYGWKGADVLLKAARIFTLPLPLPSREGNPSVSLPLVGRVREGVVFVFVGGTDYDLPAFKEKAKGLTNVLITGHKPHGLIPKYLAAADVLALPNSGKSEISRRFTSPLKMFEYMAAGKPIVAVDLPSIREILNEDNAILVKPDDPQALAQGISRVLQDQKLAAKLAREAKEQAQIYSWLIRAKTIINLIH